MKNKIKVPFIEQHQKTECGLCCVAMLASYYNHEVSIKELRNTIETGRDGTSFIQLVNLLKKMNFHVKAYKIPNELENVKFVIPKSIALWNSKHFVVIDKITKRNVYVIDPEIGRISYTYREFMEGFSEYLISVRKTDKVKKRHIKTNYSFIKNIFTNNIEKIMLLLILTVFMYFITFIIPIFIREIINSIDSGKNIYQFKQIFPYVFLFGLLYYLISVLLNNCAIWLRSSLDKDLNRVSIIKLFKLPYKFYSNRSKGDIIYSLNGLSSIRELFANKIITGILDIGILVCISVYLFYYDSSIFFIVLLLFNLNLILLFISKQKLEQNNTMLSIQQNLVQNKQMEIIYSMMGIKMEGFEDDIYKQRENQFQKYIFRYTRTERFSNYINSLLQTITFISPFIILLASISKYSMNKMSIGTVISIYSFSSIFFSKTDSVFNTIVSIINSKVFILRINDILSEEDEKTGKIKHIVQGDIELKNVSYSYTKDSKEILKNVNMTIKKGQKIAIVGTSGSGKSTISKLIVGLYSPIKGEILYDGLPNDKVDLKFIRKQIGIIPQDITLFNKTIKDNILNGLKCNMDEVIRACKLANIHNEIMDMPMKYNTIISEMGLNLSGGQRQRIILARTLLKKPKIVLLDEATSYLDNINEKLIMDEFKKKNITLIVIAHRLSTIIDSDMIYVFNDGNIIENGTHDELINKKTGLYRQLYLTLKGD
ncbi:peptidase domain-containing ABC transporter [Anaerococcus sp. AGMB09787]|uniref:peptidase domain-containing ABC transporter n=1 Tax=Anaerococcus sp. AGMB09787 TaxID=2922869 RepID=UPI001FAE9ECC|nr:peptidase domain-containing ABC transporter [Anaerococcus sp. AGMB09787]